MELSHGCLRLEKLMLSFHGSSFHLSKWQRSHSLAQDKTLGGVLVPSHFLHPHIQPIRELYLQNTPGVCLYPSIFLVTTLTSHHHPRMTFIL